MPRQKKQKEVPKSPIPDAKEQKKLTAKMLKKQAEAEKLTKNTSPKTCPEGMIRRPAYIKESHHKIIRKEGKEQIIHIKRTIIPAACIPDRGRPGVGLYDKNGQRVFIHLPKEVLGQYGYKNIITLSLEERHKALDKAYIGFEKNWLSLFRTLNYLALLNKSRPAIYERLMQDRNYIRNKYSDASSRHLRR
jgi:hypothetical protein